MAGIWYRAGTVAVTAGSTKVVGTGTTWKSGVYKPDKGHAVHGPDGRIYELDYVESDTVLYLVSAYVGPSATGQAYSIDITRTGSVPAFSRELAVFNAYQQGQLDSWQMVITGTGMVTLTAPDGQKISVPALSSMLNKDGNLAGLPDKRQARVNLGLTQGAAAPVDDDLNLPSRLMRWSKYGAGHVIFDASSGKSPTGSDIDVSNSSEKWSSSHPVLMGWNGEKTYGLRVDSSRVSDSVSDLVAAGIQDRTRSHSTGQDVTWFKVGEFDASNGGSLGTLSIKGYIGAWVGAKDQFDLTIKNREGLSVSGYATGKIPLRIYLEQDGGHSVWIGLGTYCLASVDVFAAGNGLVGYKFGDVKSPTPPAGEPVWVGEQSTPVLAMKSSVDALFTEGSFTPTIARIGSNQMPALPGSANTGRWRRTGDLVTVTGVVYLTETIQDGAGLRIGGLPFVVNDEFPISQLGIFNCNITSRCIWGVGMVGNPFIDIWCIENQGAAVVFTSGMISNNNKAHIRFSLTYKV